MEEPFLEQMIVEVQEQGNQVTLAVTKCKEQYANLHQTVQVAKEQAE